MEMLMGTGRQRLLAQQLLSVERGMTFLQQQHLVMLTGLHMEISHLKTRCHELSCELNSKFSDQSTADEEEQRLSARCASAERLLWERQGAVAAARAELRAGRARSSALARSLREEERHFLDELKRRSHRITSLSRDLQRQTALAAALSQELHDTRIQLYEQRCRGVNVEEEEPTRGEEPEGEAGAEEQEEKVERRLLLGGSRHARRGVREERVRACVPRESVASPQRPRSMPDPALFLFPLRYRLLRWRRHASQAARGSREEEDEGTLPEDEWEDIDVPRRVDMGAGEGETAL